MVALSSLGGRLCSNSKRLRRPSIHRASSVINNDVARNGDGHAPKRSRALSSDARDPLNVAFVGLGNMGMRMALNLATPKNGGDGLPPMRFAVHDLQESNTSSFLEQAEMVEGLADSSTTLSVARDLASVGESSPDFVVTSLPTCEASEAVVGDIVRSLPSNRNGDGGNECIFIDTSTISPNVSKKLHQLVTSAAPRRDYVDAPVSGGVKGATDATLTFMVGCSSPETFDTIGPLLRRMGRGIIPCGGAGSGSAVKLCNNAALAAQMLGICEAMNLGDALGVDPIVLAGAMNISTAKCWSSEVNNPHPAAAKNMGSGASANGYEGGFGASLMLKDLNLAVDAGEEEGLALPVAGLTRDLYRMADLHGYGRQDFGVMLEFLKGIK